MGKRTLLAILVAVLCLSSFLGDHTTSSFANPLSTDLGTVTAPAFTVCPGTFALCTSAKCKPSSSGLTASCLCDVKQAFSAGTKPCSDVPQAPPQPGQVIPSRYSPITRMAVCTRKLLWAMCLDSQCTVDKDPSKATCTCNLMATPEQSFVVVTDSFSASTCTASLVSSATVHDVIQITGFLQNHPNLPARPITILGVDDGMLKASVDAH